MTPTAVPETEETIVLNGIPGQEIRAQLERVLRSRAFIQSHRIRRFLQFIVEESLLGQPHRLKEYLIGLEVFDRRDAFDPRVDSIVRVEARRLRHSSKNTTVMKGAKISRVSLCARAATFRSSNTALPRHRPAFWSSAALSPSAR